MLIFRTHLRPIWSQKLSKLEKFFDRILDTQVVVSYTRGMHVVEITSDVNNVIMRGEDYAPDIRKAFDKALKNIERANQASQILSPRQSSTKNSRYFLRIRTC